MPLGAPIGTGLGIANSYTLRMMRELITDVPLIVDAGLGTCTGRCHRHGAGFDGVLLNTAMATSRNPVLMSSAMKKGVEAGREAFSRRTHGPQAHAPASSAAGWDFALARWLFFHHLVEDRMSKGEQVAVWGEDEQLTLPVVLVFRAVHISRKKHVELRL